VRVLCFVLCSLIAGSVLGTEVYRSVDENGVVTFSDRPSGDRHELVVVNTTPPAAAPAAPTGRTAAAPEPDAMAETGDTEETPSERELAEQRSRNCEIATERAERYSRSRRLYRALPDGEREYLNEEQTAAARADAEADVATWCS
jgi:hypothetical protein